jgi:hypothetical protein
MKGMIWVGLGRGGAILESAKEMLKPSIYVTTQAATPSFTPAARTRSPANISAKLASMSTIAKFRI